MSSNRNKYASSPQITIKKHNGLFGKFKPKDDDKKPDFTQALDGKSMKVPFSNHQQPFAENNNQMPFENYSGMQNEFGEMGFQNNQMPMQNAAYNPYQQAPFYPPNNSMFQNEMQNQQYANPAFFQQNPPNNFNVNTNDLGAMYENNQAPFTQPPPPAPPKYSPNKFTKVIFIIILLILLPAFFTYCLFIDSYLNFLRYIFLSLSILAIGSFWGKPGFSISTKLTATVVYIALCTVSVVLAVNGDIVINKNKDVNNPSGIVFSPTFTPLVINESVDQYLNQVTLAPEPTPQSLGPSQAEKRLTMFMQYWMANDILNMVKYTSPLWVNLKEKPEEALFFILSNRTPLNFEIESISGTDDDKTRIVTMIATINKNNGNDPSVYRLSVIMNKEQDDWFVDPLSLATNDEMDKEEEVVVTSQEIEAAYTEAPRMTQTPVPEDNAPIYFNVEGGSFYHIDPNCVSVSEKYLPLTGSFPYSELSQHRDLRPCLRCGAPHS